LIKNSGINRVSCITSVLLIIKNHSKNFKDISIRLAFHSELSLLSFTAEVDLPLALYFNMSILLCLPCFCLTSFQVFPVLSRVQK
jgi:hypothetical protein